MRVLVWNEHRAERNDDRVAAIYPDGLHGALAAGLRAHLPDAEVTTATLDDPGHGLAGRLMKQAYLGNSCEYTFETELGPIFVVSTEVGRVLGLGSDVGLQLAGHGVSVVQAG